VVGERREEGERGEGEERERESLDQCRVEAWKISAAL
jgi:hypothetical protein